MTKDFNGRSFYEVEREDVMRIWQQLIRCLDEADQRTGENFLLYLQNKLKQIDTHVSESASAKLTKRESEVADLILACKSNEEIAKALFISLVTVKKHVSSILRKAGVKNRAQFIKQTLER